ncbi:MAG: tRNA (adenosine(37)-N6)-threonylcarbamoyltransferase complex ATPase subunit type 1 TsaE [Desulfobacteraceae bacterium]|nr:tRNA (adenosine(37)-N6)-threonylcarbamoyltransferase complex ATPase subunit type 1 TsaE [Desulfobacteraceae bacterium]
MATSITLRLESPEATAALGRRLGEAARPGDVVTLGGSLGAGKTTLTQAIGQGLGVPPTCYITSPTFSLLHEYPGRLPLYHLDLYRLGSEEELAELGVEDWLYGEGMAVIEWPDRLGSMLPAERLHIELRLESATARTVTVTAFGSAWEERLAQLSDQPPAFSCQQDQDGGAG